MQSFANPVTLQPRRRALSLATASFTCVAVLLSGCSSSPVSQIGKSTKVEYYPSCYEPVQHLRDTDSNMTKSVATGAVIGAVGGALVGGAAGYYTEKQKQITDDHQRLGSYAADADKSAADIDRSVAYAQASQSCYQQQFSALLQQRKAGTIKDEEGRKRLAEIVAGLKESNDLITAVSGKAGEDLSNYTQAYEKDLQTVGVERKEVTKVATAKQPKPTAKVTKEVITTEQSLQKAQAKQKESQQVASRGRTLISDVCNNPDMGDWAPASCKA